MTLRLEKTRAREILDWLVKYVGAGYEFDESVVVVTSYAAAMRAQVVLKRYDVRDITSVLPDFPGPDFALTTKPPAPARSSIVVTFAVGEDTVTASSLAEMMQSRVRPDSWAAELGTSIEERSGRLYVMQTPEVHALIDEVLSVMRVKMKRMVEVELVLARLDPPPERPLAGLLKDGPALALMKKGETVFRSTTISFDNSRHHMFTGEHARYVGDMEISGDMHDPVVRDILDGFSVDVVPVSAEGGRTVTLDLRFQWSELSALTEVEIGEWSTNERKGSVKVQEPSLGDRQIKTSVCVPRGSWAAIGLPGERGCVVFVRAEMLEGK